MAGERIAYTFTGQGSQRVGMWGDLRQFEQALSIFAGIDKKLGIHLSRICEQGPIDDLTGTSNAQPAIVAHSLVALLITQYLHPDLPPPEFYLGHSVGEFSALAAAGVVDLMTAVYLVRQRGLLMERVGGGMIAILGRELQEVEELCKQSGAEIANINCPGQIVVSGSDESMNEVIKITNDSRRVRPLSVSGPFHSSLMAPLKKEWRQILDSITFQDPTTPIILNVEAKPATKAEQIKASSVEQLALPVRWWQSVDYAITNGVTTFIEFGPGKILTGLLEKINPETKGIAVTNYQSAESLSL